MTDAELDQTIWKLRDAIARGHEKDSLAAAMSLLAVTIRSLTRIADALEIIASPQSAPLAVRLSKEGSAA